MAAKVDEEMMQTLRSVEQKDAKFQAEVGPKVYAFGSHRPMGRIRSYSAAGLGPFAGRGMQQEFHLLGHLHFDANDRVTRVEGFNGGEGERWAKAAETKLREMDLLAEGAVIQLLTPLKGCQYTGIR